MNPSRAVRNDATRRADGDPSLRRIRSSRIRTTKCVASRRCQCCGSTLHSGGFSPHLICCVIGNLGVTKDDGTDAMLKLCVTDCKPHYGFCSVNLRACGGDRLDSKAACAYDIVRTVPFRIHAEVKPMEKIFLDDWNDVLRTLVVGALAYVALVFLLRISGKRTLSKMNAFDFIVTLPWVQHWRPFFSTRTWRWQRAPPRSAC